MVTNGKELTAAERLEAAAADLCGAALDLTRGGRRSPGAQVLVTVASFDALMRARHEYRHALEEAAAADAMAEKLADALATEPAPPLELEDEFTEGEKRNLQSVGGVP